MEEKEARLDGPKKRRLINAYTSQNEWQVVGGFPQSPSAQIRGRYPKDDEKEEVVDGRREKKGEAERKGD